MTDMLTQRENESIRKFVHQAADEGYLRGRVLDYGCGTGPYRRIVEEHGGVYEGYDRADFPENQSGDVGWFFPFEKGWDAILCNQVVQYVPLYPDLDGLEHLLISFQQALSNKHGHLVLTYPTNWPEVQEADLHRFTKAGMERLLTEAGFTIVMHERRATSAVMIDANYVFALGYGVVAGGTLNGLVLAHWKSLVPGFG